MKKIEPVAWRYTASGYKKWHYSEQFPVVGLREVASIGKLDALWTDDALQVMAEAVRDATWQVSGEGWNGEYPGDAKPDVDIAAIINQLKGE